MNEANNLFDVVVTIFVVLFLAGCSGLSTEATLEPSMTVVPSSTTVPPTDTPQSTNTPELTSTPLTTQVPTETRAGVWTASTECGDFSFVVTEDGTLISQVEFSVIGEKSSNLFIENQSGGWIIAEDGTFDMYYLQFIYNIIFKGQFNQDAMDAVGTLKMPSGCSCEWDASRSP